MTKVYANAITEYYDLHLKPENEEICTCIDDKGNRQSMHWFIPKSKEDVIKRRKYTEFLCRHFKGGIFTRPPAGMNVVLITQVDAKEPWAKNSRFKNGERDLRSEEHTSELQSLMRITYAVFCLKKKKTTTEWDEPH